VSNRPFQQKQEPLTKTNDDNSFRTYENPAYGIQIQYPSNWRIYVGERLATYDIVSFLAPVKRDSLTDIPSLNISTDLRKYYLTLNLNGYLTKVIKGYNHTSIDFKVIESSTNSILAGKPAYKLVFTNVKHGLNFKTMEIGAVTGKEVYAVTYTAEEEQYSHYLPTVQKMIDSFKKTTFNN
jgi:PsbP-like protein